MDIVFIESHRFTSRVRALGLETALRGLQLRLRADPDVGVIDAGTGCLRKVRLRDEMRGKGTRGGARAHYLYVREAGVIYLLSVYGKHEQSSLTPAEKQMLRRLVQTLRDELHRRGGSSGR